VDRAPARAPHASREQGFNTHDVLVLTDAIQESQRFLKRTDAVFDRKDASHQVMADSANPKPPWELCPAGASR